MRDAVICEPIRTPVGGYGGTLCDLLAALGLSRVSVVRPSGARQVLGLEDIGTAARRRDQHV
ncbi:hypothetical protein [Mameliella alba]|uniref:hypothetical protein n=1 Tax=Mameliella alba TaxID=561184 RepID=UPI0012FF5D3B|nr:hypothetical protein [Mameliella alba]MBY6121123.1 hypothetical protein [Mameliella alba]